MTFIPMSTREKELVKMIFTRLHEDKKMSDFTLSLESFFKERGYLTKNQFESLQKVFKRS